MRKIFAVIAGLAMLAALVGGPAPASAASVPESATSTYVGGCAANQVYTGFQGTAYGCYSLPWGYTGNYTSYTGISPVYGYGYGYNSYGYGNSCCNYGYNSYNYSNSCCNTYSNYSYTPTYNYTPTYTYANYITGNNGNYYSNYTYPNYSYSNYYPTYGYSSLYGGCGGCGSSYNYYPSYNYGSCGGCGSNYNYYPSYNYGSCGGCGYGNGYGYGYGNFGYYGLDEYPGYYRIPVRVGDK